MRRTWLPLTIVALVASVLVAFAACKGDNKKTETPTATPAATAAPATPPSETPAATAPGPTEGPFEGAQDPVEGRLGDEATPPPVGTVVDVRAGEHTAFDRIVFEFADAGADYTVAYVDGPVGCGTGEPMPLDGEAFLQINLHPAQAHDDAGQTTIDALEFSPGFPAIVAAVQTCDFEGYVTWVVGLPERLDFRVTEVEDPLRLAVDVAHPQ
jgi:hypothetical protein